MTTRVEYHGQACIRVTTSDLSIATDPWFFPAPWHLGWEQFPAPSLQSIEEVSRSDFFFISHDHEDHFDPTFISRLRGKTIIAPNFKNKAFISSLRQVTANLDLVLLENGESLRLSDQMRITVYMEQPRYRVNSVCVVETQEASILNANDCGLDRAMISEIRSRHRPDVLFYTLNFAANSYPLCFTSKQDRLALADAFEISKRELVEKFDAMCFDLDPRLAFAYAGPIRFSSAFNFVLNQEPDLLDWSRIIARLKNESRCRQSVPGDVLTIDLDCKSTKHFQLDRDQSPQASGSRPVTAPPQREDAHGIGKDQTGPRIEDFFLELEGIFKILKRNPRSQLELSITPEGQDPSKRSVLESFRSNWTTSDPESGLLRVFGSRNLLDQFVSGAISYDTLQLSQMAFFERTPDIHDSFLHDVLKFCRDEWSIREYQSSMDNDDSVALFEALLPDGNSMSIKSRCPHEGEPLDQSCVDGWTLTCPRHKWKFDLRTGECVRGGPVNLFSKHERHRPLPG